MAARRPSDSSPWINGLRPRSLRLGGNQADLGLLAKEFANPPGRDPKSLGDVLQSPFGRVYRRHDPIPQSIEYTTIRESELTPPLAPMFNCSN
jgi:hypothetical protein